MKKTIILFSFLFLYYSNSFSQSSANSDSVSTLQSRLENLKKAKAKIDDSISDTRNKIDSLNKIISNREIEKYKNTKIVLELKSDATLSKDKSIIINNITELKKGQKVIFLGIGDNEFLKVKYKDKVGYILNNQFKNENAIKKLYSNAEKNGQVIEGSSLEKLSKKIGKERAKKILKNDPRLANLMIQYGEFEGSLINAGKVSIGMTKEMVISALGSPNDKNITQYSWGTNEQWIYETGEYKYLYFKNDKLTTIQK